MAEDLIPRISPKKIPPSKQVEQDRSQAENVSFVRVTLPSRPQDLRGYIPRCAALLGNGFILRREDSETKVSYSYIILIIGVHMID
jgi:hypothetical protein